MIRVFKNPFYIYSISFSVVLLFYSFGWSGVYPTLSETTLTFFLITFLIAGLLGFWFSRKKIIKYQTINVNRDKMLIGALGIIFLVYGIEVMVAKGCPLCAVIDQEYAVYYKLFGLKYVHVIVVTFNTFFLLYSFHYYRSRRTKSILFLYLLAYLPSIIIMNRGIILTGALGSFFIYILAEERKFRSKDYVLFILFGSAILYVFGMLGNLRMHSHDPYLKKLQAQTKAAALFTNGTIPSQFYWTYLYTTSPLANFQHNIDETKKVDYALLPLVVNECLPEVISKRVGLAQPKSAIMIHGLTADSVYSKSYSYAKWYGPIVLFLYMIVFIFLIVFLIPKKSEFHTVSIAMLSTLIFLNIFDNMFVFSGTVLVFFYPLFFQYLIRR